jgi:hypothetical protein
VPLCYGGPLKADIAGAILRSCDVKRLVCLLSLGFALAAAPVLGAVKGVPPTVATVSPPLSNANTGHGGCTPINPCAVATPALGNATLPVPEMPVQPNLSAVDDPAAPSAVPAQRSANADCPPARGRGALAGRAGNGRGEGGRRLAQAGAGRNGGVGRGAAGRGRGGVARGADGCPRPTTMAGKPAR